MSLRSIDSDSAYDDVPPGPAERRQRLAVLCALDRAQLRLVLAPAPRAAAPSPVGAAAEGVQTLLGAARFLPGKLGLWSRRIGMAASFVRLLR